MNHFYSKIPLSHEFCLLNFELIKFKALTFVSLVFSWPIYNCVALILQIQIQGFLCGALRLTVR